MDDLNEFLPSYERALATQDWRKVAPLIHDDCVAVFSEGTYIGKAEVERAFRRTFALIEDERYKVSDLQWVTRMERMAVCIYGFSWSGLIGGRPASGAGRGTSVLVNEGKGWQLICEHLGPLAHNAS